MPAEKTILAAGSDGTVRLWEVGTGKHLRTFEGHKTTDKTGVPAVAIVPDGTVAASGDTDGTIIAWNTQTLKEVFKVKGHTGHVRSLVFTPNGKTLVSGSWDGTVKTWDPATGKEIKTIPVGAGRIENLAVTPDGKEVVVACPRLSRWDLETGTEVKRYATGALSVAISADGNLLLVGRYGGEMNLRALYTGFEKAKFVAFDGNVYGVAISPDGKTAATAGGGEDRRWQTGQGEGFRSPRLEPGGLIPSACTLHVPQAVPGRPAVEQPGECPGLQRAVLSRERVPYSTSPCASANVA